MEINRIEYKVVLPNKFLFFNKIRFKYNTFQIYPARKVNSLYFDTNNFDLYKMSKNGELKRFKVRTRWYDQDLKHRNLEIKSKNGIITKKNSEKIQSDKLIINKNIFKMKIQYFGNLFYPKSLVSYERNYFYFNGINLSIDRKIKYFDKNLNSKKTNITVLEFKFQKNKISFVKKIISEMNFTQSKYSKYVNSIDYLYS